jgi:oligopeptide transport system permease protein
MGSLYIALLAALLDLFVDVPFAAVSGFMGGRVDGVLQPVIEILNGIPNLVVAILAMVIFEPGILTISIAIGLTDWTYMARIVRGKMLQLKDREFTLASRSLGAGRLRLV